MPKDGDIEIKATGYHPVRKVMMFLEGRWRKVHFHTHGLGAVNLPGSRYGIVWLDDAQNQKARALRNQMAKELKGGGK